jgi:putative nucleotidyltransferase with HDIG domain
LLILHIQKTLKSNQVHDEYTSFIKDHKYLNLISETADHIGLETYVIGGFVRDLLLKRGVKKDLDFVCVGSGISLAEAVAERLGSKAKFTVYKNFGTAAITYQDQQLEFVGARKESYRANSRKPVVEDGTLKDDQLRRDFTINALAIGLSGAHKGKLIDPFDGRQDLDKKIIRTPLSPSDTFSDDPLRIMRAFRFASQLQFDIEHETFLAASNMAERLSIVSMERISDELNKIILSNPPSYGFKLMFSAGVLKHIFPEMHQLQGVAKIKGKAHKDNFFHTLQVLDNLAENTSDLWLRWAAILHDIAKPATQRFNQRVGWTFHGHEDLGAKWVPKIFKRLKLPLNEKMKYVKKLVRLHLRPIALVSDEVTDSAIRRLLIEAGDDVDDLMMLCKADITSKNHDKVRRYLANFKKVEKKLKEVEEKDQLRNFKPPVTGEDIMEAFDIPPSRAIGEIKAAIKDAIMEGEIPNQRMPALELMMKLGEEKGLKLQAKS